MTLVDTSVWIAAFRSAGGREAGRLRGLLDADEVALGAPVRVELLSGASAKDRLRLRSVLSALPYWVPGESTWGLIDSWLDPVSRAGERFGVMDLLVAALAAERGATLWSLDSDFERMARLSLITLHRFA